MDTQDNDEFDVSFSDLTLIEFEGKYSDIKDVMDKEHPNWCLCTTMTITNPTTGCSNFELDLHHDGKIIITDYEPSIGDVFYNPDISCLSVWSQKSGWQIPEPLPDLVRIDIGFWKYFWETSIINSLFLDNKYGERNKQDVEDDPEIDE